MSFIQELVVWPYCVLALTFLYTHTHTHSLSHHTVEMAPAPFIGGMWFAPRAKAPARLIGRLPSSPEQGVVLVWPRSNLHVGSFNKREEETGSNQAGIIRINSGKARNEAVNYQSTGTCIIRWTIITRIKKRGAPENLQVCSTTVLWFSRPCLTKTMSSSSIQTLGRS